MSDYDYEDYEVVTDEEMDYDYEEEMDHILAQQELEDFAQDGYFENMEMGDDGFWH
jgi:hypothetical protein